MSAVMKPASPTPAQPDTFQPSEWLRTLRADQSPHDTNGRAFADAQEAAERAAWSDDDTIDLIADAMADANDMDVRWHDYARAVFAKLRAQGLLK